MHKSTLVLSSFVMLAVTVLSAGTATAATKAAAAPQATAAPQAAAAPQVSLNASRGNAENGALIFNEGKGDAAACMGCHGETALGNDGMGAPRLANIGQKYIIKQLADFAADKRIPEGAGAAMNDFSKALNEQDRRDLAVYLDTLDYATEPSDLKGLVADGVKVGKPDLGKIIVTDGIKGKVPACQDCHGFNGRDPRFPAINQQKYVYLVNQLNQWRSGARANDQEVEKVGIMRGIAKKLSEDDILNIAAFLSTAPRVAPGAKP